MHSELSENNRKELLTRFKHPAIVTLNNKGGNQMQLEQVKTAIDATPKGANVILEWVRPMKVKKSCTARLTKSVRMVGRLGIDYDKQKAVQAKRENGDLPAENQGLPWGFWIDHPWHLGHNKGMKKDNPLYSTVDAETTHYVRLYKGTSDRVKPEVHFFKDGQEIELSAIENDILSSEKTEKSGDCFSCKTENVTRIHSEAEWMMVVVGSLEQMKTAVDVPVPAKVLATIQ